VSFLDRVRGWADALRQETVALWFAVRDPRTPLAAKVLAGVVIAYALSPIDLIPDFIPVLGYLDELLLLPLAIWLVVKLVPEEVLKQSRAKAREWFAAGQRAPRSRLGALIVVVVWVVILWWLIAVFAPSLGGHPGGQQDSP
jgi:uncharacterized membrane protein YkvA (DUF1232 family)